MSGVMSNLLLSNSFCEVPLNHNEEWYRLDARGDALEEELDRLRTKEYGKEGRRYLCNPEGLALDRVRAIRKELASIDAKMTGITLELNPKHKTYWGL